MSPASAATSVPDARARWRSPGIAQTALLGAFMLLFLLPGLVGHDPWKQDETYTFGIVQHMLESGDFIVPMNAGQPFMEKPPLYYWLATLSTWLFSPWLPMHDAARLVNLFCGSVTLFVTALTARRALGCQSLNEPRVIGTLALFAGGLLVQKHLHDMFSDVALMMGAALATYGLLGVVLSATRASPTAAGPRHRDAVLLGLGVGMAWLSKGVFMPGVLAASALCLPLLLPACRNAAYARALGIALLVFAPFGVIWPLLLALRSQTLFISWFWDNNVGRFLGFSVHELGSANDSWVVARALLFAAIPSGPLALAGLCAGGWRRWRCPEIAVPLVLCALGFGLLLVSATARELYILPLMLPLALLAADTLARFPARWSLRWDLVSRLLFAFLSSVVWVAWAIMQLPADRHRALAWLGRWLPPDYVLGFHAVEVLAALALTLAWLMVLPMLARLGRWRGPASWAAGATLLWGLIFTLLLPWLNEAKSYQPVFSDLARQIAPLWAPDDCMASVDLGESEAPMLYYVAHILHRPGSLDAARSCRWLILDKRHHHIPPKAEGWALFWSGARHGDRHECLQVFRREGSAPED
ncbi:MAG: ArnT family glycosyltransferase [Janthinobacterium lividum]